MIEHDELWQVVRNTEIAVNNLTGKVVVLTNEVHKIGGNDRPGKVQEFETRINTLEEFRVELQTVAQERKNMEVDRKEMEKAHFHRLQSWIGVIGTLLTICGLYLAFQAHKNNQQIEQLIPAIHQNQLILQQILPPRPAGQQ
jgi:hypothetical protein